LVVANRVLNVAEKVKYRPARFFDYLYFVLSYRTGSKVQLGVTEIEGGPTYFELKFKELGSLLLGLNLQFSNLREKIIHEGHLILAAIRGPISRQGCPAVPRGRLVCCVITQRAISRIKRLLANVLFLIFLEKGFDLLRRYRSKTGRADGVKRSVWVVSMGKGVAREVIHFGDFRKVFSEGVSDISTPRPTL
jgi:hypothetical protein